MVLRRRLARSATLLALTGAACGGSDGGEAAEIGRGDYSLALALDPAPGTLTLSGVAPTPC